MGLLLNNSAKDIDALKKLFQGFATSSKDLFEVWGFSVDFLEESIIGISELAASLFDGGRFPEDPGAFKRAAAVCLCTRLFVDVRFNLADGVDEFTEEETEAWMARIGFMLIPMVIKRCVFTLEDGRTISPSKIWKPASFHVRMELLGLLRWLETPLDAAGSLDVDRLAKAILALALIIEQSYYLVGAEKKCDVHDQAQCYDKEDPICSVDAMFLSPDSHEPYTQLRVPPAPSGAADF